MVYRVWGGRNTFFLTIVELLSNVLSMTFAEYLAWAIAHSDLSQAELARRLGVDRSTVCQWHSGALVPATDRWSSIAGILGCTEDFIALCVRQSKSQRAALGTV